MDTDKGEFSRRVIVRLPEVFRPSAGQSHFSGGGISSPAFRTDFDFTSFVGEDFESDPPTKKKGKKK